MLKNKKIISLVLIVAVVAFISGLYISEHKGWHKKMDQSQFHGTFLDKPRAMQPFELTGIDDTPFTQKNLQGQWTLMFFGFTHCGGVCPTTMAELAKTYQLLEKKRIEPLPRVVMVSLDPERDDLNTLARYVRAFNSHFYGARGKIGRAHV